MSKDKSLDLTGLRSAVGELVAEKKRIEADLENLKRKREDIANAPAGREDLIALADAWINEQAERYSSALRTRLLALGHRGAVESAEAVPQHLTSLLGIDSSPRGGPDKEFVQPEALVLMLGPQAIKAALAREIDALEIPNEGLPAARRKAELAKLDKQIGEAEEQLAKLRAEASAAGVTL